MRPLTSAWGAAKAVEDPPRARVLSSLIDNDRIQPEVVARIAILSSILSERDFDQLTEKAKTLDSAWPRFVARSLTEPELPELANFLNTTSKFSLIPTDAAAQDAAAPIERTWIRSEVAKSEKPHELKHHPKSRFLYELLGEKTAAQLLGDDKEASSAPAKPVPTPGAGTSRRLGRHSSGAQYRSINRLTPLGRKPTQGPDISAALEHLRKRRDDNTNGTSESSGRDASLTMKRIAQTNRRKTVTVLSDDDELPLPNDSQRAIKQRMDEATRRKAAAAEATKQRRLAREQQKAEAKRKKVVRKREARQNYLKQNARLREYEYAEDEDNVPVSNASSEESPRSLRKLPHVNYAEEVIDLVDDNNEDDVKPMHKKARVSDNMDDSRVPRRRASESRRRLNANENSFARPANRLRNGAADGPSMMRPPPVFTSGGSRDEDDEMVQIPSEYDKAVGEYRDQLNEHQKRQIIEFITHGPIHPEIFDEQGRKEYVLNELDQYSLVLRLCISGKWQRVRYNAS